MPETPSSKEAHRGRCLCGEVNYTVHGPPIRVTICYCTFCQRATGSTYLFEPIWPADALSIVEGKPKIYSTISAGSGKEIIISFCDRCGTKLFQHFERFGNVVGLYGGTLDDPARATEGAERFCIFIDEAPKGAIIPAGVNVWRRHRVTNDGEAIAPVMFDHPHAI